MSIVRVLNKFLVTLPQKMLRVFDCLSEGSLKTLVFSRQGALELAEFEHGE
ncbi:hypothetical protein [Oxobacter pfennigii]|uniref:hypothetical protein n=1 Tax=Oxobacter pfennigii TaxID=36849 RepID=UPI001364E2BA|nr:hypothetical protein [Oxobacter pfennigii]